MKLLKSLSVSVVLVSLMSVTSIASAGSGHPTCVDGKCYTQSQIDFYNKARKIMAQRAAAAHERAAEAQRMHDEYAGW
tara:strand:+ start:263 stop:496 length:234 start_codon:yes stop_codon:yes gene_type:complete